MMPQALICQDSRRSSKVNLFGVAALQAVGVICVIERLKARWKVLGGLHTDDWLMVATLVIYIPASVVVMAMWVEAFGFDVWTLEEPVIVRARMYLFLAEIFYIIQLATTKASMICLQYKIFKPIRAFRITASLVLSASTLMVITITILVIIQTKPVNYWWNGWLDSKQNFPGEHEVVDIFAVATAVVAANILFDVIIILMPIPLVLKLNMRKRDRAAVSVLFGFGVLITACSCVRIWTNFAVPSYNFTWDYVPGLAWGTAECGMSYIVTSLPTLHYMWMYTWKSKLQALTARWKGAKSVNSATNQEMPVMENTGWKDRPREHR
ncbi:uncharacterized protein BCR38DRAFT_488013 [Pseudomassariella vexata]|uniref:Rhodopsin domain-containing protein n=1 Tax=Pseudomassariella vexata TaxID=1141098 RepID=A0A1Y2DPB5_9PEZI|nr:uncharacterized protein BCR38DRAFT_488013 [Pseudomassariella vexata]ORY60956.1 hypothetical protein BCR38DRAFT_488013 [Pseudomassariella vexata]